MESYYSNIARRWALTLLDFCFKEDGVLYNYPTLIFYQMGYSLFTIWQASRRHYRLNQREECRTYYMAARGTVQEAVIALIAQKMSATSAIQGKFSVEGLSAMAQGVDVKLKLAQALSNMDGISGANLQEMFDVLQADDSDADMYGKYRQMLTFAELIGEEAATAVSFSGTVEDTTFNIFDLFDDSEEDDFFGEISFVSIAPKTIPAEPAPVVNILPVEIPALGKNARKRPPMQRSFFECF